ncbi:MAG: ArnT family glycosyltransferase [Myxococcota bacterium]
MSADRSPPQPGEAPPSGAGRSRRPLALALLLGLGFASVLGFRLGAGRVILSTEERCFEPARQMLATGDWLVPHFRGHPRVRKPPLYTWLVAISDQITGEASRLALRAPSAIAGVALLALTFAWGRTIAGTTGGLLAASLLALMDMVYTEGRRGNAEMVLALLCGLSLFSYERLSVTRRRGLAIAFAGAVALAFLAKATAALLLVGLPIVATRLLERRLGEPARPRMLGWMALAVLPALAWYAAIVSQVPGAWQVLSSEAVLPLGVKVPVPSAGHVHPIWFHVGSIVRGAFPMSLLLPVVAWRAWKTRLWSRHPGLRLPALGFVASFVALSLLAQKQRHYVLPLLPLLALLGADSLAALARDARGARRLLRSSGALAAFATLAGAGAIAFYFTELLGARESLAPVVLVLGAGLAAGIAWAGARLRPAPLLAGILCTFWLILAVLHGSYRVWISEFKSDAIRMRPSAELERWDGVFRRHPFAIDLFHADDYFAERQTSGARRVVLSEGGARP